MLHCATLTILFLLTACGGASGGHTVRDDVGGPEDAPGDGADTVADNSGDIDAQADTQDAADAPPDAARDSSLDAPEAPPDISADIAPDVPPTPTSCRGLYEPPTDVAMGEDELQEASGIVASRQNPGVLWLHNDSGDVPRLFAVGTDGAALGRLTLTGAEADDWEDIATGACPDGLGYCLWVGDVGDNAQNRDDAALYAVREPVVDGAFGEVETSDYQRFAVSYGGEQPNFEALIVAPNGAHVWMFEKAEGDTARIFHAAAPFDRETPIVFSPVAEFPAPGVAIRNGRLVTGADLHPTGTRVLIRVYTGSFEYRLGDGQTPAELGAVEPVTVAPGPLSEGQGEAIAYSHDGIDVWTISESPTPRQNLHFYACPD